jgi:hypothetical protein
MVDRADPFSHHRAVRPRASNGLHRTAESSCERGEGRLGIAGSCGRRHRHSPKHGKTAGKCLTRCCNLLSQCCTTAQIPVLPCLRPRSLFPIRPRSRSTAVLDPASDPGTASSSSRPRALRSASGAGLISSVVLRPVLPACQSSPWSVLAVTSLHPDRPDRRHRLRHRRPRPSCGPRRRRRHRQRRLQSRKR